MDSDMYVVQMIDTLAVGGAQQLQVTFAKEAKKRGIKLAVISLSEDDGSPFPGQLRALGVDVHFFSTIRIFDLDNLSKIVQWLRSERPDILHTHLTYSNIIGSITGLLTRTPVVTTLHLTGADEITTVSRTERVEMFALRHLVSRLIACGPAVARYTQTFVKRKPIVVIPNALDNSDLNITLSERNVIREQIAGDADRLLLISVGRLVAQKGFADLLDAFSILLQSHPALCLVIVGDGDLRFVLEEKIKGLGLSESVHLLGRRSDVPQLLSASDVYVLASRWEGLPIAVLEAMAAGLPVITTDVGDNAWALDTSGLVVPPRQPDVFASTLASLLDDPVRRSLLGQAAKARIDKNFSSSVWFDSIISVYEGLLH
jgi:glycosyltransferase involved in cell wall biosynthesis